MDGDSDLDISPKAAPVQLVPDAATKEVTRLEVTAELMQKVETALRKKRLVKIGSRAEDDGMTCISLRSSTFNNKHAEKFASWLILYGTSLKYLDLSDVQMTAEGFRALRSAVMLSQIEHLALRHNNMDDSIAKLLLLDEANPEKFTFRQCPLRSLDLRYNNIGDGAAAAIVKALSSKHHLRNLNLSENHLTSVGRKNFADASAALPQIQIETQTSVEERRSCRSCQSSACAIS